jgi:hypothetical protein
MDEFKHTSSPTWRIEPLDTFYIHLLDLTRNSCEKCKFRSLAEIEPARPCDSDAALSGAAIHRIMIFSTFVKSGLKISVGHGHCPTHSWNCPTYSEETTGHSVRPKWNWGLLFVRPECISAFFKEFSLGGQNREKGRTKNMSRRGLANAKVWREIL